MRLNVTCLIVMAGIVSTSNAADWRQFRGNAANSVAAGESLPTELSGDTIAWNFKRPSRRCRL